VQRVFSHSINRLLGMQIFRGACVCTERNWSGQPSPSYMSSAGLWLDGVEGEGIMYVARNWRGIFGMRLRVYDA